MAKLLRRKGLTPTLPGVGILFKFMSTLGLIPFGWNQKEGRLYSRPRIVFYYWTFAGVILPAAHTIASVTILAKAIYFISKSNDGWDNVKHLLRFSQTLLFVLPNASFTCYAVTIWWNYEETVKFYNETIRLRIQLRGSSSEDFLNCQAYSELCG